MNIKLDALYAGVVDEIIINEEVIVPQDYLNNSEIIRLEKIIFSGKVYRNSSEELILTGNIKGVMILEDSINLEEIPYSFSSDIEEILQNNENTIDILPILWQNIVLEVPLKFTKVKDFSSYSGDGWRLISEEEVKKVNPFLEIQEKINKE